jgi:Family of unknown function (DUF5923)
VQIPSEQTTQLKEAITNLRDVTILLIRSSEFRSLLFDAIRLFGVTVQRAGERKQQGKPITGYENEPDVPLTDEEKQQLDNRMHTLLTTLSQREEYSRSVNILFDLMGSVQEQGAAVSRDPLVQNIMADSKALLGEFVGHYTLDSFLTTFRLLIQDIRGDVQMRAVFRNLRVLVQDAFYADESRRNQLSNQFYQARDIINSERFRARARELQRISQQMYDNFRRDEDLVSFRNKVSRLVQDFAMDQ